MSYTVKNIAGDSFFSKTEWITYLEWTRWLESIVSPLHIILLNLYISAINCIIVPLMSFPYSKISEDDIKKNFHLKTNVHMHYISLCPCELPVDNYLLSNII